MFWGPLLLTINKERYGDMKWEGRGGKKQNIYNFLIEVFHNLFLNQKYEHDSVDNPYCLS